MSCFQDGVGKWPTEFDGKCYQFQDEDTYKWWDTTLQITEIPKGTYHEELQRGMDKYEYVLVYQGVVMHAVYVDKYNAKKQLIACMNSDGQKNPFPRVETKDVLNLYKVIGLAAEAKRSRL